MGSSLSQAFQVNEQEVMTYISKRYLKKKSTFVWESKKYEWTTHELPGGNTLLIKACHHQYFKAAALILDIYIAEWGSKIVAHKNKAGETALLLACRNIYDDHTIIQKLLKYDVNYKVDMLSVYLSNVLAPDMTFYLTTEGQIIFETIVKLFLERCDPNATFPDEWCEKKNAGKDNLLLRYIKKTGRGFLGNDIKLDIVHKFIKKGINVNHVDADGNTFLMALVLIDDFHSYLIIKNLLKDPDLVKKYDWSILNENKESLLSLYVAKYTDVEIFTLIHDLSYNKVPEHLMETVFDRLLANIDPNKLYAGLMAQHMVDSGYKINDRQRFKIILDPILCKLREPFKLDTSPLKI